MRQLSTVSISKPSPHSIPSARRGRLDRGAGRAPGGGRPRRRCSRSRGRCSAVPNSVFATPLRPALPERRSRVMSSLPPPGANRLPLAKSAPATSAATKRGDLGRVGGAVGVEHHDDVAGGGGEPAGHRVALALAGLGDRLDRRQHAARGVDRAVGGVAVDDDDLVDGRAHRRDRGQHDLQVLGLVPRRDDHADQRERGAVSAAVRDAGASDTGAGRAGDTALTHPPRGSATPGQRRLSPAGYGRSVHVATRATLSWTSVATRGCPRPAIRGSRVVTRP